MNNTNPPIQIKNYTSLSNDMVESVRIEALNKEEKKVMQLVAIGLVILTILLIVTFVLRNQLGFNDSYNSYPFYLFLGLPLYFFFVYTGRNRKKILIQNIKEFTLPLHLQKSSGYQKLHLSQLTFVVKYSTSYLFYNFNQENGVHLRFYRVYELHENEIPFQQTKILSRYFRYHFILRADELKYYLTYRNT